jgi:hypothetical protein
LSQVQFLLKPAAKPWRNLQGAGRPGDRTLLAGQALLTDVAWVLVPMDLDLRDGANGGVDPGWGIRPALVGGDTEHGLPGNEDRPSWPTGWHAGWV